MSLVPLAERMRPKTLEEVLGQDKVLAKDGPIMTMIRTEQPLNLILWGPPGCGKTTLARLIAKKIKANFVEISAVSSGKKEIEEVIKQAKVDWNLKIRTIMFVDEIHRFNKAQQDAFLPHVESGLINLIGATTENPSFEVISPLLSRCHVIALNAISKENIIHILKNALKSEYPKFTLKTEIIDYLAEKSNGDARAALNNLELIASLSKSNLSLKQANDILVSSSPIYDKKGDMHYDLISAFIKSMRGSNVNASLYYLSRMLTAGEDPKFIARRMIIFASEDIGLAGNGALTLATSAFLAVERVGMPESQIILAHVVSALALSKKSRQTTNALFRANDLAKEYSNAPVPFELRNAPTQLMKDLGYNKGYKWEANFQPESGFLPDELKNKKIF